MKRSRVLISGAGIAGPALASWLVRYGFDVTVVEKSPSPRPGGQAVDLRGAARGVVERMGLMPSIRLVALNERGLAFLKRNGQVAATMPADAFGGEGIVAEIEVLRGDLCRILLETTRGSVEYVFGDSIAALNESGSHVSVRFENGKTRDFAFEDVGWRVPALLDSMREASDFYFGSVCQVFVDRWSRGRTVLLGDAAYCASPLTGLGTSMALVGAYVLAGELAASPDDPTAAFGRYQDELRTYVTECQKLPPGGVNGYAPQSRAMIGMRNLSMRLMTAWPVRSLLATQFQTSDGSTLKDYSLAIPADGVPAVSRP